MNENRILLKEQIWHVAITRYQALHLLCLVCARVSVHAFPAEVPSRAQ